MTRRERYVGFLARSHARMLNRLNAVIRALAEEPAAAEREMPRLLRAAERLSESLANLMELPEGQREPHRRPNARKRR